MQLLLVGLFAFPKSRKLSSYFTGEPDSRLLGVDIGAQKGPRTFTDLSSPFLASMIQKII